MVLAKALRTEGMCIYYEFKVDRCQDLNFMRSLSFCCGLAECKALGRGSEDTLGQDSLMGISGIFVIFE